MPAMPPAMPGSARWPAALAVVCGSIAALEILFFGVTGLRVFGLVLLFMGVIASIGHAIGAVLLSGCFLVYALVWGARAMAMLVRAADGGPALTRAWENDLWGAQAGGGRAILLMLLAAGLACVNAGAVVALNTRRSRAFFSALDRARLGYAGIPSPTRVEPPGGQKNAPSETLPPEGVHGPLLPGVSYRASRPGRGSEPGPKGRVIPR